MLFSFSLSAQSWGTPKKDRCIGSGRATYSARLANDAGKGWDQAAKTTSIVINGVNQGTPDRTSNQGLGGMWGEWDIDDKSCLPIWGAPKKDRCIGNGIATYSARLASDAGLGWDVAAKSTAIVINGVNQGLPKRTSNQGVGGMWGEWDLKDNTCVPKWDTPKKDNCKGLGIVQYSARLSTDAGMGWEAAAKITPITINGVNQGPPKRTSNQGVGGMWGEWDVKDDACVPKFGALATPAADMDLVRKLTQVNSTGAMPAIFNLDMPPVGDQGGEGSCVAWACGYAAKSFEMKKATGLDFTFRGTSATNIIAVASPEYLFNRINVDNNNCVRGSYFVGTGKSRGALDVLKTEGVVTWAEAPYSDKNGCGTVENEKEPVSPNAAKNRIKNYIEIKDLSTATLKTLLLDQHPIVFSALVSDGFMSAGPGFVWSSGEGGLERGHAMTIIGYDDAKKAYKVQNSWGTGWGDNGYFWLDYEFAKTAIKRAFVTYSDNLDHFRIETPGYVTVYCEAGYVAWCKLSYTLPNGENKLIEENLSLFFTFKKVIPPGAVNITLEVGGHGVLDPLKLKQSWSTSSVQACYKIWGTIFDTEYGAVDCAY